MSLTKTKEFITALGIAYKQAGNNAYFGNGFYEGVLWAEQNPVDSMVSQSGDEGSGGPKNLRGDFRRLIQVHIDSYNHNAKDQYGFISDKAKYKLEAMESFLESAIKSNLVGEDF